IGDVAIALPNSITRSVRRASGFVQTGLWEITPAFSPGRVYQYLSKTALPASKRRLSGEPPRAKKLEMLKIGEARCNRPHSRSTLTFRRRHEMSGSEKDR